MRSMRAPQTEDSSVLLLEICLKIRDRIMAANLDEFPVIESGTPYRFLIDAKPQSPDQMQRATGRRTEARDVARVGRNLRLPGATCSMDIFREVLLVSPITCNPGGERPPSISPPSPCTQGERGRG